MYKQNEYKGLIPGNQSPVEVDTAHWKFGIIRDGVRVVDPQLHYTAFPLGYDDHGIIDSVCQGMKNYKPEVGDNLFKSFEPTLNGPHLALADKLYEMSNGYRPVFALSGSDGIEVAVKLAFAYHQRMGNTRTKIISFDDAYHGATLMTLSVGSAGLEKGFHGMTPYKQAHTVSAQSDFVKDINWSEVACLVVETCPHTFNIRPYSKEVWDKIAHIQSKHDVIVIVDDIFMGGGKTGSFFGFDQLPVNPDVFVQGKAITGGFFPLSIAMYNERIHTVLKDHAWMHGHTYSFSLSGVLSALSYIDVLHTHKYMDNVDAICDRAKQVFDQHNIKLTGNYGTIFLIEGGVRFALPINADDEYFEALPDTINALKKRHGSQTVVEVKTTNSEVWNWAQVSSEITSAMRDQQALRISFVGNGACLQTSGMETFLLQQCEQYNYNIQDIVIDTANMIEPSKHFQINKTFDYQGILTACKLFPTQFNKTITQRFGMHVRRSTAPRLDIATHIQKYQTQNITYQYDKTDDEHLSNIGLEDLIKYFNVHDVSEHIKFLSQCPQRQQYDQVFVDVIGETFYSGTTFFPTEKTWISIQCMTPFIVHGPKHYIKNLHDMGFQTFNRWWSEDYSNHDVDWQLQAIKTIIDEIATWSMERCQQVYEEMQSTLLHNKKLLQSMYDKVK